MDEREDTLAHEFDFADHAHGELPGFPSEQAPEKSREERRPEDRAHEDATLETMRRREEVSHEKFADWCHAIDPAGRAERLRCL